MLDGKLLIFFHRFMSCICKYIFLNYSGPNSMMFSWDWTWWVWRGAQRAMGHCRSMAAVMDQLCRWPWLYKLPQLHRPFESCACSSRSQLTLKALWEYFPLQKPLKGSRKAWTLLLGSLTQPRAADFARSIRNTDLQRTVRAAVGAGVLFPEAVPSPEELECH